MSDARELEPPVPFSRSMLWRLQRASYEAQGPLAWRPGGVPLQVTSNPFIARCYAAIIAGLVHDLRAARALRRPLRILELGAGSGRFGFYLLHALEAAFARTGERPFRLIMTDLAERNLAAWAAHPKLQPFVERGLCDFARFDAAAPGPLALRVSGEVIEADDGGEPVVAIANYFFDSIPNDVVMVDGGLVREGLVALDGTVEPMLAALDPAAAIDGLSWRVLRGPARGGSGDAIADAIVREYATSAEGMTVLLPVAGFAVLEHLARLGGGRALVLTTDKGHRELALRATAARDELTIVRHGGCVSLAVNYQALARCCELRGGFGLPAAQRHDALYAGVLGVGLAAGALPRGLDAVDELERFGPGDYQRLVDHTAAASAEPTVEHVLTLLRLGGFDPRLVARFAGPLEAGLRAGKPDWIDRDVEHALEQARALHFEVSGRRDGLLLVIGTLLFHLRRPARAIVCLEDALDGSAADAPIHLRLALCWLQLGRGEEAMGAVARALELAPDLPEAQRLKTWLETGAPPEA